MIVNRSSTARQTNVHNFRLLGSTDMTQRFPNSSCFGDHDGTKVFAITTYVHCQTSAQRIFFNFINISAIAFIAFYCKIRLALTYGILADPVTYRIALVVCVASCCNIVVLIYHCSYYQHPLNATHL